MMGDAVDNIPGIVGIGEKTAKKLIQEYGSLENLLENTSQLKGKMKENVENCREIALLSKKLATISIDVPIDFEPEKLLLETPNWEKIKVIFEELEFKRLYENIHQVFSSKNQIENSSSTSSNQNSTQLSLFDVVTEEENPIQNSRLTLNDIPHFYQLVDDEISLDLMIKTLQKQNEQQI